MKFRELRADEVEVRVATCNERGVSLLLYKDSRVDQRILDETVKPENWQKRFYECKGTLFCSVGIDIEHSDGHMSVSSEWVWKDDAGEPSNMSAQKGEASDAFKRACFNWGIGRELYTAPFIWIPANQCNIKQGRNGKPACFDHFSVSALKIDKGEITELQIYNRDTRQICFAWASGKQQAQADPLRSAKVRLAKAIDIWAERTGQDAEQTKKNVPQMPGFAQTVEFYTNAAKQFEEANAS